MTSTLPPQTPTYEPLPGGYDEMLESGGQPRAHWQPIAASFAELGIEQLRSRSSEASRLLAQDGVVYNAYSGSAVPGRRWRLDPLPTVLSSHEWSEIETGVIERAELLSLVLEDIYGPRELIRKRMLPPEVIFGHAGFLLACDQIRIPGSQQLWSYAVDLGRDAAGNVLAMSDRSQAPSGAGYALENRNVISKVLPSLYRDAQVHRLAPFFRSYRAALQDVAPRSSDDPRIVVLTPGPLNETAFEHAAIASTLGYPLVQGADLTVRGDRVWMRSVGQFEPVDVILRRVDGGYCDPLELRPDSQLGIPGLLEIVRGGNVTVVNQIGSSVLENPALAAFLPKLSEQLLGRELKLPSVQTWWCGDEESRRYVTSHLEELLIRPADPAPGEPASIFGWELSAGQVDDLRRRINHQPGRWCGQQELPLASGPVLGRDGLESRRSVLRAFAVARGDSYVVMPGGLTRVPATAAGRQLSGQTGAVTKDTWVLASEPEAMTSFWLRSGPAIEAVDPMASIPSRAAESLWWLGRYAERAEGLTRLLRTVIDRHQEFGGGNNPAGLAALAALQQAIDVTAGGSTTLAQPVGRMLDNAYAVRDQLSRDTWLVIGPLERALEDLQSPIGDPSHQSQAALGQLIRSLLALGGLGVESMVRDLGWRFMDAGRRLERAIQLVSLLKATLPATHGTAVDSIVLESVLGAAESIITYRFRYRSHAQLETVLDLLLLDRGNPRSLVYQLDRLTDDLAALPLGGGRRMRREQRLVLEAYTALQLGEPEQLVWEDPEGRRPHLDALLGEILELLLETGSTVDSEYFVHTVPTFSLVGTTGSAPSIIRPV